MRRDGPADRRTARLEGRALTSLDDDALTRVRRDRIGFVFQFFNLLPTLTIGDNIALPCLLAGMAEARPRHARRAWPSASASPIDCVTIRSRCRAARCSGPRSPARSCTSRRWSSPTSPPATSIPTTAPRVLALLAELNRDLGITILLATHAAEVAAAAGALSMRDGRFGCVDGRPGDTEARTLL